MKRIFISSTFSDFHKERDLLRNKIIPMVNKTAKEYGDYVGICDLRWGIDTSLDENSESKVLSVCLDEIDRSRPYMLVFLGDRYGYVPEKEYIIKETEKRGIVLDDLEISITQLEIEYGAFNDKETLAHTLFYFREIETFMPKRRNIDPHEEKYQKKLISLKQRIQSLAGDHVHFYKIESDAKESYEKLCKLIQEHLINEFIDEWKKIADSNLNEKNYHNHWSYIREKSIHFKVGYSFANTIMTQLENPEFSNHILVLTGAMGTGKSTCLSYICTIMNKKKWDVIPIMCGNTALSTDEKEILRYIIWMLEKIMNIPHIEESNGTIKLDYTNSNNYKTEISKFQDRFYYLCDCYGKTSRHLLLAVDAIDQLLDVKDIRTLFFLPQGNVKNIRTLLTTTELTNSSSGINCYNLPTLTNNDKIIVADKVLQDNGKQLTSKVCDVLFSKEISQNPLFLYLAINNLCLMDEEDYNWINQYSDFMEGITNRQIEIVNHFPDNINQMASESLKKVSKIIQSEAIERCIDYLAVSRHGLRIIDLDQLLKKEELSFVPLHFSQLIHFMNDLYVLRFDGRYDYLHRSLRDGILNSLEHTDNLHRRIAEHLMSLSEDDVVRQQELYYHLIQADMNEEYIIMASQAIDKHRPEQNYVMEELYHQCIKDDGFWFLDLIKRYIALDDQIVVASFYEERVNNLLTILYYFETEGRTRFLESKSNIMIYHDILLKLVDILEEIEKNRLDKNALYHILALGYSQLGNNLKTFDTPEAQIVAEKYFDKAILIREMQIEQSQTDFNAMELAITYLDKGDWLNDIGNSTSKAKALAIYEHAMILMCTALSVNQEENYVKNQALLYSRIGNIHFHRKSLKEIYNALNYYSKSEEILRDLTAKYESDSNLIELSRLLCKTADAYIELESNENIQHAITLYQEAYELVLNTNSRIYFHNYIDELSDIYYKMAFAYTYLDNQQSLIQAFETFEKAFNLANELSIRCGLTTNYRDMIAVCHGICIVSLRLAESTYLEQALTYAHMASNYSRTLVSANHTMKNVFILVKSLYYEGEVYETIGTDQAFKKATKLYDEAFIWVEELNNAEYNSVHTNDSIIRVLEQTGHIYERRGGTLNYKKALSYYERALAHQEKIIECYGTSPDRQRGIEISCNKAGNALMCIGEKEFITNAKAYIERALNIAIELAQQIEYDKYQWDLSFCYNLYATLLWKMDENMENVIKYYQLAFDIRKNLNDKQSTLSSKKTLGFSYERLVLAYSHSPNYKDQVIAVIYINKYILLYEEIMKQENTPESKRNLSNAYKVAANQYDKLSVTTPKYVIQAEEYYKKCLNLWMDIITEVNTYRAYIDCIQAFFQAAQFAMRLGQYNKTNEYFEKTISLAKDFLQTEPEEEYKLLLPDIYMYIGNYYESQNHIKYQNKCFDLYNRALAIYESIEIEPTNYIYISNMAAISYSIAYSAMVMEKYKEAFHFYKRNIELTLQIPDEARSQQRIICLYSSYNCIGAMYLELNETKLSIEYFRYAIECEEDALKNIKEEESIIEIVKDLANDTLYLANIYQSVEQIELAMEYYDKGINMLCILLHIYQESRTYEEQLIKSCINQIRLKLLHDKTIEEVFSYVEIFLGLLKKYPEYEDFIYNLEKKYGFKIIKTETEQTDLNEELIELYNRAEYYFIHGEKQLGIQIFEQFQKIIEQLPNEKRSEQVIIYEYNIYNHLATFYANQNTQDNYKTAINYFLTAIQKESDALKMVRECRKQEIMNDIYEDCSHAIILCEKTKDYEEEDKFYSLSIKTLITMANEYSEEYELLLAKQVMEYIIFKIYIIQNEEALSNLLYILYVISQKHPELSDLSKFLYKMFEDK